METSSNKPIQKMLEILGIKDIPTIAMEARLNPTFTKDHGGGVSVDSHPETEGKRAEGNIPHLHVKPGAGMSESYVLLEQAEYGPHNGPYLPSDTVRSLMISILSAPWKDMPMVQGNDGVLRSPTTYHIVVEMWLKIPAIAAKNNFKKHAVTNLWLIPEYKNLHVGFGKTNLKKEHEQQKKKKGGKTK